MAWLTGFPREKIEWYPTIDPKKCVKCGMCLNCGRNVYDWTKDGAKVVRPYNYVQHVLIFVWAMLLPFRI
jgi:ferredoxin